MTDLKAQIAHQIYRAVERLTDELFLLGAIGGYGDTLDDEDVLICLIEYNRLKDEEEKARKMLAQEMVRCAS